MAGFPSCTGKPRGARQLLESLNVGGARDQHQVGKFDGRRGFTAPRGRR